MSNYITIKLSKTGKHKGKFEAIVSVEDAVLDQYNWAVRKDKKTYYAHRTIYSETKQKSNSHLHREVLARKLERKLLPHEQVDHIDGNGLNNTRDNLRLATNAQNQANRGMQRNNTSGYKGVSWHKGVKKWTAQVILNRKHIHLGCFDTKEEANAACIAKRNELHGDFAKHE